MMTAVRDSISRRSRRFKQPTPVVCIGYLDHCGNETSASDLIRQYFAAYEHKDRMAVESLLTNDFLFTSAYDHRVDREAYFKRCWPYGEKSPTYGIGKVFEKGNEVVVLCDCETKNGGGSRNAEFFTIEGNQIREVEVYFGSRPA
jgi:hypothetical protein